MKKEKLQEKSLKELYNIFWRHFSIYVRYTSVSCFTCGKWLEPKNANAGHYIHEGNRDIWLLKSDSRNVHAQCVHCNKYLRGNLTAYALRLEAIYGSGVLQELESLKWKDYTPTKSEVIEGIEKYKMLGKDLTG